MTNLQSHPIYHNPNHHLPSVTFIIIAQANRTSAAPLLIPYGKHRDNFNPHAQREHAAHMSPLCNADAISRYHHSHPVFRGRGGIRSGVTVRRRRCRCRRAFSQMHSVPPRHKHADTLHSCTQHGTQSIAYNHRHHRAAGAAAIIIVKRAQHTTRFLHCIHQSVAHAFAGRGPASQRGCFLTRVRARV